MTSDLFHQYELAPCKVNLTLDVFPPRPDGFHDLDSIVLRFAPGDLLDVEAYHLPDEPAAVRLTCSDPSLPTDARNLAFRAAQLYLERIFPGTSIQIEIDLRKDLPHQAGLGGGSSDAATVLAALAERFGRPDSADLRTLAAELGSDVPLFLTEPASFAVRMRGRGEIVESLTDGYLSPLYGVLVKPDEGVPTPLAYRLLDELPNRQPGRATEAFLAVLASGKRDAESLGAAMSNDFEAAILPAFPGVAEAHRALQQAGAVRALLCGSGAAVFGLARDAEHARSLVSALTGRFPYVQFAESLP